MPVEKNGSIVDPVDAQIGGDADVDGIGQTLTADDINAVLLPDASAIGFAARIDLAVYA